MRLGGSFVPRVVKPFRKVVRVAISPISLSIISAADAAHA